MLDVAKIIDGKYRIERLIGAGHIGNNHVAGRKRDRPARSGTSRIGHGDAGTSRKQRQAGTARATRGDRAPGDQKEDGQTDFPANHQDGRQADPADEPGRPGFRLLSSHPRVAQDPARNAVGTRTRS